MFAKNGDPRLFQWFRQAFGHDDYLRCTQAAEWPYVHCLHCGEVHECGNEDEGEERQYQKDQRAFRKMMRRVTHLKAQLEWLTRLQPRRTKSTR